MSFCKVNKILLIIQYQKKHTEIFCKKVNKICKMNYFDYLCTQKRVIKSN